MKSFAFRTISTVILLSALSGAIFLDGKWAVQGYALFAVIALGLSLLATLEMCNMFAAIERKSYPFLAVASVLAVVAFSLLRLSPLVFIIAMFVILFISSQSWLLILTAKGSKEKLDKLINTLAIIMLLALPFFMIVYLYLGGRKLLLFMVLVTKAGDIGAYVTGSLTNKYMKGGNHKMIPSISPGKSWEGAAGGLLLSVAVALSLGSWALDGWKCTTLILIALGLVLFLGGFIGDLAESSLKRICGVKDSGRTLPGIGGVLDLLDSLLLNATIFSLFLFVQWYITHR